LSREFTSRNFRIRSPCSSHTTFRGARTPEEDEGIDKNREVNIVPKKNKVQENYQTPNEKFNAEFAEDTSGIKSNPKGNAKVQENYKKPNEKFDAEFGELNQPGDHPTNR
jgi:hypothetical protein